MLTKDRNTPWTEGKELAFPVAANAKIYAGSLVVAASGGYAAAGSAATGLTYLGRAEEQVDNTGGANGDKTVRVRRGLLFKFKNSGGDAVTQAELGRPCYIEDDETVSRTDNAGTRSPAGVAVGIESDGVWVEAAGTKRISAAAALDFGNLAAAASEDLTIAVPGAAVNDAVMLGLPAAPTAGIVFQAFVSAANVATVRATNITAGAVDPASATYRVTVVKP